MKYLLIFILRDHTNKFMDYFQEKSLIFSGKKVLKLYLILGIVTLTQVPSLTLL